MGLIVIAILFYTVLPILFLVWLVRLIVRSVTKHGSSPKSTPMTDRQFTLAFLSVAAGSTALFGVYTLSYLLSEADLEAYAFSSLIVFGVLFLLAGAWLKGFSGKFLMVLGIITSVGALPAAFEELGDKGAFLIVLLAFVALLFTAIRLGKKEQA